MSEQKHTPGPWQPIETAPNDESWFLVYRTDLAAKGCRVTMAQIFGENCTECGRPQDELHVIDEDFGPCKLRAGDDVTHWCPMPPAPATQGASG